MTIFPFTLLRRATRTKRHVPDRPVQVEIDRALGGIKDATTHWHHMCGDFGHSAEIGGALGLELHRAFCPFGQSRQWRRSLEAIERSYEANR